MERPRCGRPKGSKTHKEPNTLEIKLAELRHELNDLIDHSIAQDLLKNLQKRRTDRSSSGTTIENTEWYEEQRHLMELWQKIKDKKSEYEAEK